MAVRFRRRVGIAPGMTLNLNRRSTSLSVGGRGGHVTFGAHGTRETVGLPGTGLSATYYQPHRTRKTAKPGFFGYAVSIAIVLAAGHFWLGWF